MQLLRCLAVSLTMGCGAAPSVAENGFPAEPLVSLTSMSRQLQVALRTSPQPPTRGAQSAEYTVTSAANGEPVSGLSLRVVPWMPAMGHGTSSVPSIEETAPGTYVVTNVYLYMAGFWVLRTTISGSMVDSGDTSQAGASSDYVEPSFQIP
jgi:hypothetical protein